MARSTKTEGVNQESIPGIFFNQIKRFNKAKEDSVDRLIKEAEEGI